MKIKEGKVFGKMLNMCWLKFQLIVSFECYTANVVFGEKSAVRAEFFLVYCGRITTANTLSWFEPSLDKIPSTVLSLTDLVWTQRLKPFSSRHCQSALQPVLPALTVKEAQGSFPLSISLCTQWSRQQCCGVGVGTGSSSHAWTQAAVWRAGAHFKPARLSAPR